MAADPRGPSRSLRWIAGLLVLTLACAACTRRAREYTGGVTAGLGFFIVLGGIDSLEECPFGDTACPPREIRDHNVLAGVLILSGLVAVVFGLAFAVSKPPHDPPPDPPAEPIPEDTQEEPPPPD